MASIEVIEPRLFDGVVADEIVATLQDFISETNSCSLVLCGGSTPGAIYRCLAKPPRVSEIAWPKVKLYWGDERWVPHDNTQSNYKMVKETLLSQLPSGVAPQVYPIDTSLPSVAQGAQSYEQVIRRGESLKGNDAPKFDLVLLGLGEDGHFASVFPESSLLAEPSAGLCAPVVHPVNKTERVTILPEALFGARRVLFIVRGESKAQTLKRVIEGDESQSILPGRIWKKYEDKVTWFLDSSAAKLLKS